MFFLTVTKYGNNHHNSSMDQDVDEDMADENVQCEGCKKDMSAPSQCVCTSIMANFTDVNKKLLEIKLLDRLAGKFQESEKGWLNLFCIKLVKDN